MAFTLYALLFKLNDVFAVVRVAAFPANIVAHAVGFATEVGLLLWWCLALTSAVSASRRGRLVLTLVCPTSLATALLPCALTIELVLAHGRQLVEDLLALNGISFLAVLLVQGKQLELKLVDIAVVDDLALLVVDWELFGYQLCVLNIKLVRRHLFLWLLAGGRFVDRCSLLCLGFVRCGLRRRRARTILELEGLLVRSWLRRRLVHVLEQVKLTRDQLSRARGVVCGCENAAIRHLALVCD